jgi:hypothetical protein
MIGEMRRREANIIVIAFAIDVPQMPMLRRLRTGLAAEILIAVDRTCIAAAWCGALALEQQ